MKEIHIDKITEVIKELCIEANYELPSDVTNVFDRMLEEETFDIARDTLKILAENARIASKERLPICQDTGMACVFITMGQDVHVVGGSLEKAIHEGVRLGYEEGYLRKSVVSEPVFERVNTKDNTPALIYYDIVEGDRFDIVVAPKGFGSENMCQIRMLKPSDGLQGIEEFVLKVIHDAGPNACPPMVIGVGIGGSFDKVALLSKKAMLKPVGSQHPDKRYQDLADRLLHQINATGIGPAGYGGKTTALSLNVETYPTHIAGMPVAVSICCHVARHKGVSL